MTNGMKLCLIALVIALVFSTSGCATVKQEAAMAADRLIERGVDEVVTELGPENLTPEAIKRKLKEKAREYLGVEEAPDEAPDESEPDSEGE